MPKVPATAAILSSADDDYNDDDDFRLQHNCDDNDDDVQTRCPVSPIQSPVNRDHLILRWRTANVLYLAVTRRFVLDNDIHCDMYTGDVFDYNEFPGSSFWEIGQTFHPRRLPHLPQYNCQGKSYLDQTGCKLHFEITQACRDMLNKYDYD